MFFSCLNSIHVCEDDIFTMKKSNPSKNSSIQIQLDVGPHPISANLSVTFMLT